MGTALLVEYYNELPKPKGGNATVPRRRLQAALEQFKQRVAGRYSEGTLQRLLETGDVLTRKAALVALSLVGTMKSNAALAGRLTDEDAELRQLAGDALWSLWFRADTEVNNRELQRVRQLPDGDEKHAALDALIQKAPAFAEAYNQRAILHYQQSEFQKSIADCERVLKLNPCHFGAQVGMAQCFMGLGKPRAALKAFRSAYRLNPGMDGVKDTIRQLENALGEEGRKNEDRG